MAERQKWKDHIKIMHYKTMQGCNSQIYKVDHLILSWLNGHEQIKMCKFIWKKDTCLNYSLQYSYNMISEIILCFHFNSLCVY